MKLHLNFVPAIIAVLFLMLAVDFRDSVHDDFVREYNAVGFAAPSPPAIVPAFPGAVGDGAGALDMCRDSVLAGVWPLKIWRVTSSDTTSGNSFIEIVRDSLPLYRSALNIVEIVKDTLHIIPNGTKVDMTCTYLAGQTAQGGGMAKRGGTFSISDVGANKPHDVVIRYITNSDASNFTIPAFGERIIADHITGRWGALSGGQMNFSVGSDSSDAGQAGKFGRSITASYILVYEPRAAHPTNMTSSGQPRDVPALSQVTFYRFGILGGGHRAPMCTADTTTFAQGIVYNWDSRASETNNQAICNFVGNFHHTGPATNTGAGRPLPYVMRDNCETPIAGGASPDSICTRQVYVAQEWYLSEVAGADTLLPSDVRDYWNTTGAGDSIIACAKSYSGPGFVNTKPASQECAVQGGVAPSGYEASAFIAHETWTYPPDTTGLDSTTVEAILAEVGNSQRLTCAGAWTSARRDGFDSARIAWLRNNWLDLGGMTGLTNAQTSGIVDDASTGGIVVPGNPVSLGGDSISPAEYTPAVGTPCIDADEDGMFKVWEEANGFSDSDASDNNDDPDGDGWLNVEEFLNGSDPNIFTNPDGTESTPTYFNGTDSVWVRRISMKDSVPQLGGDTTKVPADAAEIPDATSVTYPDTATTTVRGLHFTCDNTAEGIAIIDSSTFADSADIITGITSTVLMTRQPPGCT